jgi:hypothetical protein
MESGQRRSFKAGRRLAVERTQEHFYPQIFSALESLQFIWKPGIQKTNQKL